MATWLPVVPTRPPLEFRWRTVPPLMLARMVATGVTELQAVALMQSLVDQTLYELEHNRSVSWPRFGLWYPAHQKRTHWIDPNTQLPVVTNECWQYSFEVAWRRRV